MHPLHHSFSSLVLNSLTYGLIVNNLKIIQGILLFRSIVRNYVLWIQVSSEPCLIKHMDIPKIGIIYAFSLLSMITSMIWHGTWTIKF